MISVLSWRCLVVWGLLYAMLLWILAVALARHGKQFSKSKYDTKSADIVCIIYLWYMMYHKLIYMFEDRAKQANIE